MPAFHLMRCAEAQSRFGLFDDTLGFLDPDSLADRFVIVSDGDWTLGQSLRLDWIEGWGSPAWLAGFGITEAVDPRHLEGFLVVGDLNIDGALINADKDSGPFLVVNGSLRARSVATGGASIIVKQHAEIEEIVVGTYNHGGFTVRKTTRTTIFLRDDHWMDPGKLVSGLLYDPREASDYNRDEDWDEEDDDDGVPMPPSLRPLIAADIRQFGDIWKQVCADRRILA